MQLQTHLLHASQYVTVFGAREAKYTGEDLKQHTARAPYVHGTAATEAQNNFRGAVVSGGRQINRRVVNSNQLISMLRLP